VQRYGLLEPQYIVVAVLLVVAGILGQVGERQAYAVEEGEVYLSSSTLSQGEIGIIKVRNRGGGVPRVVWLGKDVLLGSGAGGSPWAGFLPVDMREDPGIRKVLIRDEAGAKERQLDVRIVAKDFGVRRLTLPKEMVDLDAETLERVRREAKIVNKLWSEPPSPPSWDGPFIMPLKGEMIGPFGRSSIINEQPRAPHSGVDLRAKRGTPVRAINRGKVVLAAERFFSGLSVFIDHGGGIYSMYFHLDRMAVKQGDRVAKGQVIGYVGSTGRATGPHLHFGVRANGFRVDPLGLIAMSRRLFE